MASYLHPSGLNDWELAGKQKLSLSVMHVLIVLLFSAFVLDSGRKKINLDVKRTEWDWTSKLTHYA